MDIHEDDGDVADDDEMIPPERRGPIPTGLQTVRLDRPGHDGEPDRQLRVAVDVTPAGKPFASLRVWERHPETGAWWPTRQGLAVELSEGREVLAALTTAFGHAANDRMVEQIRAHNGWLIEPFEDGSSLAHPRRRRPIAAAVNLTPVTPPEPDPRRQPGEGVSAGRVPIGRVRGRKGSRSAAQGSNISSREDR